MRAALIAALVALAGPAQGQGLLAILHEQSGTVAPVYAWSSEVRFHLGGRVTVIYCRGYAQTAPGCATVKSVVLPHAYEALERALAPLAADLFAHPAAEDPAPPIGGGAAWAVLVQDGATLALPAHPMAQDGARIGAVLALLRQAVPIAAMDAAASSARGPI
jgi:hypothetical protein